LIGYSRQNDQTACNERPTFVLSDRQAEVLSCLLEIDLTLAVAGMRKDRVPRESSPRSVAGHPPIDALGDCDPVRAAAVLWQLNKS
jgi:hypothetical protein